MRSSHKRGDMNWFMKQFIQELQNRWSDITFEMFLVTAEEMKVRGEDMLGPATTVEVLNRNDIRPKLLEALL